MDVAIPNFMANKIIAYQSMREDFLSIKNYIELLLNDELTPTIKASLWYSTIALYGRCFTDAKKSKFPKLEVLELFKNKSELKAIHEQIMELRHKFVAHRGESSNEISIALMRIHNPSYDKEIIVKQLRQNKPRVELLKNLLKLIEFILPIVEKKYEKAAIKVSKAVLENFTAEQLTKMRIT